MAILPGTTPTIRWNLNGFTTNDLAKAEMTIKCSNGKRIVKNIETAALRGTYLQWTLTQEDTLAMTKNVELQLRFLTGTGYAGASPTYEDTLENILKRGVL